ncbi:TPA: Arc family DNA-binding protein [Salmonella enterica subsp. enterica serovar Birkenhead]|nr:Arc family DNA-binding protein [Salmonella enterica subsp. enterica serovar Birkenhead]HDN5156531.1 Arc family DNA-binding protein [Salmonella enterica subsp. enterica serovar Birkenhead]HDN6534669.1 Arc family DNA-binding protein [Salmonella enterica subsp. enterica serovar Birkenhead]HDN6537889.1 Arc family DNA-binding protein [Salmonella enterica subsp. enterica serovar Birkenhead]
MSKRDDPQLRVRIPQDLKDILEKLARENDRTLTAEITRRLRNSLEERIPIHPQDPVAPEACP